jgi:hypothetical protein
MSTSPNDIGNFFSEVGHRFENIGKGFRHVFEGVGEEFTGLGVGLSLGTNDISLLIQYIFIYLGSLIGCGVYFLSNLKGCIFYYLIEVIGQLLYLPVRILVWIFKQFKVDLQSPLDKFWKAMEAVDNQCMYYAGFHIIHYPKNVRTKCYVCKRLKQSVIVNKANDIDYDFKVALPEILNRGVKTIETGGREIKSFFDPWPK